ncbi:glucose-6-phosphate isomerase [Patescibacteria group bacterium]|nr:glucose-6-phosphate isomerase [Patescibacteria group bacterium]
MEIDLKNLKPDVRHLRDMKKVLYDKEWLKTAQNLELYYMYRGLKKEKGLRYDITVIPSKMLGEEFVKTKGNRNSDNYLEIYTILEGKAIFLLQKMENEKVKDVFAIKAKKGESVMNPAEYYIVSINPFKKLLKLGNWVPERNKNIYQDLENKQGACYYYTKNGWIKNKNYKNIPKLRFEKSLKSLPKNLNLLKGC